MKERIFTYHGNGRVTSDIVEVEQPTEDFDLLESAEEDAEEDPTRPFFMVRKVEAAIARHILRNVQQSL